MTGDGVGEAGIGNDRDPVASAKVDAPAEFPPPSMKYHATKLAKARDLRDIERGMLEVCVCAYPLERFRNMSSHHPDCPAHAAWMEFKDARRG